VQYIRERGGGWELAPTDIALIGEYTTANGPFVDDYFFAFVRDDGAVFQASFYAAGGNATLDALGATLGGRITAGSATPPLAFARDLAASARGHALFELRERVDGGIWHRLQRVMGMGAMDAVLTDDVERYLANRRT